MQKAQVFQFVGGVAAVAVGGTGVFVGVNVGVWVAVGVAVGGTGVLVGLDVGVCVVVAVGGGGLVAGVAAWYANDTQVVGVEPAASPTLSAALAAGHPVDVEVGGIAADSLGARRAGLLSHEICDRFLHRMVTVSDEAIVDAQKRLWHDVHLVAEPGAADYWRREHAVDLMVADYRGLIARALLAPAPADPLPAHLRDDGGGVLEGISRQFGLAPILR